MRKYRFTLLALICFVFLSTIILCSASWRILRQTVLEQQLPVAEEDTLFDYFTAGSGKTDESGTVIDPIIIYDGNEHSPTRLTKGETEFPSGITSEYLFGYNVKGEKIEDKTAAGTHHYKITASDGTDQVICYNHVVTITPDTLSVIVGETEYTTPLPAEGEDPSAIVADYGKYFERESFQTGVITWKADNSEKQDQKKDTKISVSDTDYSTTPKTLTAYAPSASDGFNANNYSNFASAKVVVSYTVLPKAKIGNTLYGSVTLALQDAAKNNSKDTVEALQSHTDGGTTYFASAGTNSASEGYFTHVIGNDSKKTEITINDGDILRIPNGVTAAKGEKITVKPHASAEAPSYEFTRVDDATKDGLFLIYTEHPNDEHPEYVATHSDAYYRTDWIKNAVTVKNTEITNNGTIIIDAVVTGGAGGSPYNSIVFGDYSKITLDSKSKITNSGTINCYGFIDEETPTPYNKNLVINDNNVQLDMESGTLNTIFTIVEHRGGNIFMGMVEPDADELMSKMKWKADEAPEASDPYSPSMVTFAFHRFYIQSVSVNTRVSGTSNINGETTLFANEGPNQATVDFIGQTYTDASGKTRYPIFQMTDADSYATLKYTHTKETSATSRKMDIDIYGDVVVNPLSISLTINKIMTVDQLKAKLGSLWTVANWVLGVDNYMHIVIALEMSSSSALLPISHYLDLAFHKNETNSTTVDMTKQGIRILPGGSVFIDEGVTVNAEKIAVYDNNYLLNGLEYATEKANITDMSPSIPGGNANNTGIAQGTPYPDTFNESGGTLTVCGTLNVGSFGGTVLAGSDNAILQITGSNSVVSKELLASYKTSMDLGISGYTLHTQEYNASCFSTDADSTLTATGDIWQNHSTKKENATLYKGQYIAKNGAWATSQEITVTYNSNGGSEVAPETFETTNYEGITLTELPKPTREHYTFSGWYTNAALTNPASNAKIYANTTLYAKWTPVSYNIKYHYIFDEVDEQDMTGYLESTFTVDDDPVHYVDLSKIQENLGSGYNFIGWFKSEACAPGDAITAIKGIDMITACSKDADGNYVVYGKWAAKAYNFIFDLGNVTELYDSTTITSSGAYTSLEEDTFPDDNESDTRYKYYLVGWEVIGTDAEGQEVVVKTLSPGVKISEVVTDTENYGPYKLRAVWGTKYTLTLEGSNENEDYPIDFSQTVHLLEDQISSTFASYEQAVKNYDDNTSVDKYFTGWSHGKITLSIEDFTDGSLTLTASFDTKHYVSYSANDNGDDPPSVWITPGSSTKLPGEPGDPPTGKKFSGWYTAASDGDKIGDAGASYTPTADITLYAQWEKIAYKITVSTSDANVSGVTNGQTAYYNDTVTVTVSFSQSNSKTLTVTDSDGNTLLEKAADGTYTFTMPASNVTITASSKGSCLAAGTLITLADGTQKKVEDLTMDDVLLVFNHETGEYEPAGIIFIENDGWDYYNVINLEFSDGTKTKLIYEHALFDLTLNKYVYITESNCTEFIGHEFAVQSDSGFERVTLTNAYVAEEYTGCYSLVTVYHLNYFIDGLFSIPGGITGLFNIFEYGDDLVYDAEKMQADIEKYGLFTYEDFEEYLPEEICNMFPAAYLKVSIGKGLMTFDDILRYIDQFIVKNGLM